MLTVAFIVLLLLLADLKFNELGKTRAALSNIALPFYWLADTPARIAVWGRENIVSRATLLDQNEQLRTESLLLNGQIQQLAALRAENGRLRELLNSSARVQGDVLIAELIGIVPDPVRHQVILNKGEDDGVYMGQPLLDASGLMGQVIEVGDVISRALLITDATHAVPVQVNRNGIRAIAEGIGRLDQLELRHVSATTDIEVGDLLITSGLGQRFPQGYPVATVVSVERDPGQTFTRVYAKPQAALNRSRHVLLVYHGE